MNRRVVALDPIFQDFLSVNISLDTSFYGHFLKPRLESVFTIENESSEHLDDSCAYSHTHLTTIYIFQSESPKLSKT